MEGAAYLFRRRNVGKLLDGLSDILEGGMLAVYGMGVFLLVCWLADML